MKGSEVSQQCQKVGRAEYTPSLISGYIGEWPLPQKEGRSLTDLADFRSRNSQMYSKKRHAGCPNALPHENLPFFASSISFPPILNWSLLQVRNFAHPLCSRSRTWPTLERKRKILHEANREE
jgi:hypothetical protein